MTREDITRLAQEAGFVGMDGDHGALRRFAALVASAERPWVGLTDEEIQYCVELKNPEAIAEEVEAKLREKNQ